MTITTPYHQGQLDFFCAIYAFINALRLMFGIQLNQAREILATALDEISAQPRLWEAMLRNQTDHHWVVPYLLGRFCNGPSLGLRAATLPLGKPKELSTWGIQDWLGLSRPAPCKLEDIAVGDLHSELMEFGPDLAINGLRKPVEAYSKWQTSELWPVLQNWLPSRGLFGKFGSSHKQKRCLILRFHRFISYQPAPIVSHWSTGQEFHKETMQLYDCTANRQATHSLAAAGLALHPGELDQRRCLALELSSLYFLEKI